jgi:hypothetical protein
MQMSATTQQRREKMLWISGSSLMIAAVVFGTYVLLRDQPSPALPQQKGIDARCSLVAAGQRLTSQSIRINCGLDKVGVQTVVSQALAHVDIADLVEKARKGQLEDEAAVSVVADRLSMSADKIIRALQKLGKEQVGKPQLAVRLAAIIVDDAPVEIVLASIGPTPPEPIPNPGPAPPTPIGQHILDDAKKLRADCSAVFGGTVKADQVDINCGPSEATIQSLITEVLSQNDPAGLVKLAMQGGDPNAPQIAILGKQLGLSNDSVAKILASLGTDGVPTELFAQKFSELARMHIDFVLRATGLPDGNLAIEALRDQAIVALGQGDYGRAEALLAAAELTRKSDPAQRPPALTIAAQSGDRGRELFQSQDYAAAASMFAAAAARVPDELPLVRAAYLIDQANALGAGSGKIPDNNARDDARRQAAALYHRAYAFLVLSFGDICPGQPAPGSTETYEAESKDKTRWTLRCPSVPLKSN